MDKNKNQKNQRSSRRSPRSPRSNTPTFDITAWTPKTELGRKVKSGEITDIDQILDKGLKILEPEIVEVLLPNIESDLLLIGQAKGKFGGGKRRVFKQTQKKTREGNKPQFATFAVVGNKNGYIGVGYGKSKETVPAREKALRNAKLNIFKITRGCGSWECGCGEAHTIPFSVEGKCGSVNIKLMPAPKGKGLVAESEVQKILKLAGLKDIWSKSFCRSYTKNNLIKASIQALQQLMATKVLEGTAKRLAIVEGKIANKEEVKPEDYLATDSEKSEDLKDKDSKTSKDVTEKDSKSKKPKEKSKDNE